MAIFALAFDYAMGANKGLLVALAVTLFSLAAASITGAIYLDYMILLGYHFI